MSCVREIFAFMSRNEHRIFYKSFSQSLQKNFVQVYYTYLLKKRWVIIFTLRNQFMKKILFKIQPNFSSFIFSLCLLLLWSRFYNFFIASCICYCWCSVHKFCPTLWNLMHCSTPGSSILRYLPEFAQIHVHWVSDAI